MVSLRSFVFIAFFAVVANAGLRCHQSAISQQNNEIGFEDTDFVICPSNVSYCLSEYSNDGNQFVYRLGCDNDNICDGIDGCFEDLGTWKRICCCNESLCVDPEAASPITFPLPKSIIFGSATSSAQIEGFQRADGAGSSVWNVLSKRKGVIRDNSSFDVACDSYHRWRDDIRILKELGAQSYRFSIGWNRILPDGDPRKINRAGIDYYNQLINGLIEAGIRPVVTMFHLDYPQALMDRGGWLNEAIIDSFANYARILFENFGDRVRTWITINEPIVVAITESSCGVYEFDKKHDSLCESGMYFRGYTLLMAHAKAAEIYRREFGHQNGRIGIAINGPFVYPATNDAADIEAANRMLEFAFFQFSDPLIFGDYPDLMKTVIRNLSINGHHRSASRLPELTDAEKQLLKGSVDFIALIYYSSVSVRDAVFDSGDMFHNFSVNFDTGVTGNMDLMGYAPNGIRDLLRAFNDRYPGVSLMIAENGCEDKEGEGLNDAHRIHYLRGHLAAISQAVVFDGVNLTDYLVWTLMDNWEWMSGFSVKMGLFHVDFKSPNKTRTPKKSAHFFRDVIQDRVLPGFGPSDYH
uniref:Myrosinase 1-like n=1 Tax=Panagrellus redivivus TaxID=6233 RepID=A0A7E4WAT8_PANRE